MTLTHPDESTEASRPLAGAHAVVVNWRDLEHSLAGGSERYAWEYATALRQAGARVELITARDRGQSRHDVRDGIEVHRGGGAFGFYAFAALSLLRRRRSLDVVIDPECGIPSFSPLFVRRSTAVVLVVHHVHQEQFTTYFPAPLARIGQWLERVAMRHVYRGRRAVAVSESTREEMADQLGWDTPVEIIGNGATVPVPDTDSDTDTDRAFLAKDLDLMVVLGRLVPHKRVDLVIRALHELRDERPGLHLEVCGKGPELDRLRWIAADLDLADRVTFHGYVAEETKQDILRRAALHVCASDIEGWGQVVIEAAAYGIPTVARDVPGLRDSIRDGETGFLVPDSEDLDEVQRRLTAAVRTSLTELEAPENRRLAFKACITWAAGFSWPRMHEEAVAVVLDEQRARSAGAGTSRRLRRFLTSSRPRPHPRTTRGSRCGHREVVTMRRVFSTALIGLGAFLVMAAVLVKFYAHPNLATMPTNYESTTELQALDATVFDAASLEPVTTDLAISSYTIADSDVAAPDGVAVWVNRSSIVRSDVSGATCDPAVDAALPGCFQQSSERVPFDAQTGAAAACPDCGSYVDQSYVDGDSYAVRQVEVTRSGQVYKAPFDMGTTDLRWWDSALGEATTMAYVGTESLDGLETYKFVQSIEPTEIGTQDLPGSVFESDEDTVTATTMYAMERTIWFAPTTGAPVKRIEDRNQYFELGGQQVPAFVGTVEYTPETVSGLVSDGKSQAFLLGGMVWLFPLTMVVLGLAAIAGGLQLRRAGRARHATDHRELVDA